MTAREHLASANAYRVAETRNLRRAEIAERHGYTESARGFRVSANVDAAAAREHTARAARIMRDETARAIAGDAQSWTRGATAGRVAA